MSINIAILGAANIALNRFMPALKAINSINYLGVASNSQNKADNFQQMFGGRIFTSYDEVINCAEVDAVYIPLPPSLHYVWAKKALLNNKHVFLEKPSVLEKDHAFELVDIANKRGLVLVENYMFEYHAQLTNIKSIINEGSIGELRFINSQFSFPFRGAEDFRYSKSMGGGALYDCGGYPIKLLSLLMGDNIQVEHSKLNIDERFGVDTNGIVSLSNSNGVLGQVYFGMDDVYRCSVEIVGSKGRIVSNRIFTAPADTDISVEVTVNNEISQHTLRDTQFTNILEYFNQAISQVSLRKYAYTGLLNQATLISQIKKYQEDHENY
ncbi:Gfo/Idh/MocA family protein [Photobacterium leiognathi]|uniref:Gfo/Idh/MocA family protein n=1 Tax=Photobacterium leiognathi TaxID=553611 RepID=UPI00020884E0|nr:Gfo/Idh/MocA family oxidoreductase [Photobacterium leiognathi]PSW53757.1 gfo/Idh/MocA family oxidoreductase [Photobacterium leiognathi subsp. mandapamensis]GAA04686.1 oxidoreductase, NAD-binding Rossmann fold family protein [Photobacterium leiognathi subsp. mandapamensis svers.1.1.]